MNVGSNVWTRSHRHISIEDCWRGSPTSPRTHLDPAGALSAFLRSNEGTRPHRQISIKDCWRRSLTSPWTRLDRAGALRAFLHSNGDWRLYRHTSIEVLLWRRSPTSPCTRPDPSGALCAGPRSIGGRVFAGTHLDPDVLAAVAHISTHAPRSGGRTGRVSAFERRGTNARAQLDRVLLLCAIIRQRQCGATRPSSSLMPTIGNERFCGSYNVVIPINFEDETCWMLKVPANGTPYYFDSAASAALTSEARTMQFLKKNTTMPIPEVFAFDATLTNEVGCPLDRKSTRLNSSHSGESRMPSSA